MIKFLVTLDLPHSQKWLLTLKAHHDCGHQEWNTGRLTCNRTDSTDDWVAKSTEKAGKILFHLQIMEGRRETKYGWSAWVQIFRCPCMHLEIWTQADQPSSVSTFFVNTGMDIIGSFYIEDEKPDTQMHYLCLFTWLVARAVHLDVCHDLSTDCLLVAIHGFVSRRWSDLIVTDNGENFTWTNPAMKLYFQRNYQPENEYIRLQLAQRNIHWTSNSPLAPHVGGVWERLIQTAKRSPLIVRQSKKNTVFERVVAEVETVLNSWSFTHVGCSISNRD